MERIIIFSHYTEIPGPSHKWLSFLQRKKYDVDYIFHPLIPAGRLTSEIKMKDKKLNFKIWQPLQFMLEGIISLIICRLNANNAPYDLAVCFDPFSFFNAYIYKSFYPLRKVVYYNIDYSKKRYGNILLELIYQRLNLFAYLHCDYFFAITSGFRKDLDPDNRLKKKEKCFLVSHTVRPRVPKKSPKIRNSLIYCGTLSGVVNFDDLFTALNKLNKEGIPFIFDIYGKDGQERQLKKKISEYSLARYIRLKGITDYENLVDKILPSFMIGVCPYVTKTPLLSSDYLFQADNLTTKMVDYISRGLPLISTFPYRNLKILEKNKFGFIVENDNGWYNALKIFFSDTSLYRLYSDNALKYSKRFDEEKVIGSLMRQILNHQ